MSPEFCLRWNNHRPNLVNVFKELLHHEVLVDVTLAAEGQFIHAHRLVLSACSLYFKELFAVNPCQHPIVILKDFHIADLKTVVEFIYQGEVNVAQERLPNVLKTAESLRIKGLAENPRTFEDYQQQHQQQTGNSSATPRLGSQSSQQQSSSLSDSLDQQSVEGEDGPPASPHSPAPPPHKRKRVHTAYEHHDTAPALIPAAPAGTGSEGVRVKEEPVSGNGHQRHPATAGSDAPQSGVGENESTNNNRDSPSDKIFGGGGGGGGGSPTPPPPSSLTPSLSNVSMAPGDSAAPALTPPDCSVPLSQQQGGVEECRPITLAPASPFISTCHSTTSTPTTSSTSTAESTSTSSTAATIITPSSAAFSVADRLYGSPGCASLDLPVSPAHRSPRDVAHDHASPLVSYDTKLSKPDSQNSGNKLSTDSQQLADAKTVSDEGLTVFTACPKSNKLNSDANPHGLTDGVKGPSSVNDSLLVEKTVTGNRAADSKDSNNYTNNSVSLDEKAFEQSQKVTSGSHAPVGVLPSCAGSVSITKSNSSAVVSPKPSQIARANANHVINITPKKSESNTSSLIAEALKKLTNSSNSLTIVNISTNQGSEEKNAKAFSPKLEVRRRREGQSVYKVEATDVPLDTKEFNFEADESPCKSPRASANTLDTKDFFATLTNSCPSKVPNSRELSSGVEVNHTAAMMMMLNNNNTTVTPAPVYSSSAGTGFKRPRVPDPTTPSGGPCFPPLASHDASNGCPSTMNTNNSSGPPHNGPLNNLSLPSLLAPLGPHAPSFLLSPHSWHQQFRCMSPNMLMAIEAVRAGKMGFTQAGRTFGVNGRTLWVYYRRLGYKVHNTFRGRRSKDTSNANSIMAGLPQPLTSHPLNSNNFNHNRLPPNFNPNSSIFFGNASNGNNNFSAFGNSAPNLLSRGMSSGNIKLPTDTQNTSFQSFQSKFFDNSTTGADGGSNNNSSGVTGECAPQHSGNSVSSSMPSCGVGGTSNASGFALNHEPNTEDVNREVPSPSSLIGPMFGSGTSYSQEETDASAYGTSTNDLASNQLMNCSQQQASFTQAAGFGPVFFGNGSNFVGFGGGEGPSLTSGLSSISSNSSHVKQELTDACAAERQLAEGTREVEEANSTLEALLEACTNRAGWQHSAM